MASTSSSKSGLTPLRCPRSFVLARGQTETAADASARRFIRFQPVVSPDSRYLAFVRSPDPVFGGHVFLQKLDQLRPTKDRQRNSTIK